MKTRSMASVVIAACILVTASAGVLAAQTTPDTARMEACFREHGKLMSKPALTNMYDCWRVHGYLMGR